MASELLPAVKGMAYDFPLRPGFLAQVVLPLDLTMLEAKRIAAFVESLAIPGPMFPAEDRHGQ
jgi:hypothetical protein